MAHVGQKFAFGKIGGLRLFFRPKESCLDLLAFTEILMNGRHADDLPAFLLNRRNGDRYGGHRAVLAPAHGIEMRGLSDRKYL